MKQHFQDEIDSIVSQLVTHYQPEKIILFGSVAWGRPTKDSDLDILVVKEGLESVRPHDRYMNLIKAVDSDTAVDFLIYTPYEIKKRLFLNDPFFKTIMSEGKVLYGS